MARFRNVSRADRLRKRRRTKRNMILFSLLGVVLLVFLFVIISSPKDSDDLAEQSDEVAELEAEEKQEMLDEENEQEEDNLNEENGANENDEDYNVYEDVEVEEVSSTDENVIVAYRGDWQPIGTSQTGEHVTDYNDGSQDRIEIKRAVSFVTNIEEDDMIEHWIGNDGHQKVQATVSSKSTGHFYRVYLTWVDEKGWKPTKVERLKEYNG